LLDIKVCRTVHSIAEHRAFATRKKWGREPMRRDGRSAEPVV
jgi:hypothetical protein